MTRLELLKEINEALQRDGELREDMSLDKDVPEWDSLSALSIIALFDKRFSVVIRYNELSGVKTVGDLMDIVKDKLE